MRLYGVATPYAVGHFLANILLSVSSYSGTSLAGPSHPRICDKACRNLPADGSRQRAGFRSSDQDRCHGLSKADPPDVARRRSGPPARGSTKPPFSPARCGPQSRRHDRDLTSARSSDEAFFAVQWAGNKAGSTTLGRADQIARQLAERGKTRRRARG